MGNVSVQTSLRRPPVRPPDFQSGSLFGSISPSTTTIERRGVTSATRRRHHIGVRFMPASGVEQVLAAQAAGLFRLPPPETGRRHQSDFPRTYLRPLLQA